MISSLSNNLSACPFISQFDKYALAHAEKHVTEPTSIERKYSEDPFIASKLFESNKQTPDFPNNYLVATTTNRLSQIGFVWQNPWIWRKCTETYISQIVKLTDASSNSPASVFLSCLASYYLNQTSNTEHRLGLYVNPHFPCLHDSANHAPDRLPHTNRQFYATYNFIVSPGSKMDLAIS